MAARVGILGRAGKGGYFDFGATSGYFSIMAKFGIAIADDDIDWAKSRIASGDYIDLDAYISQLIHRDRTEIEEAAWLQIEIDKGRASGLIDRDASEVLREVMAANRAARG